MKKYIKFFIALLIFFFGSLFKYIPVYLFNLDMNTISNYTSILLTTFSNTCSFLLLVIMFHKDIVVGWKNMKKKKFKPLETGFIYWFCGLMIMVISNFLLSYFNSGNTSVNEESVRTLLKTAPLLSGISISILAPTIEELVFRQSFGDIFKNKWIYVCTSGLLFGALHVFINPIYSLIDVLYLIPYCSMGIAFACAYYKTKNILSPLLMHIIHNFLNILSVTLLSGVIL